MRAAKLAILLLAVLLLIGATVDRHPDRIGGTVDFSTAAEVTTSTAIAFDASNRTKITLCAVFASAAQTCSLTVVRGDYSDGVWRTHGMLTKTATAGSTFTATALYPADDLEFSLAGSKWFKVFVSGTSPSVIFWSGH